MGSGSSFCEVMDSMDAQEDAVLLGDTGRMLAAHIWAQTSFDKFIGGNPSRKELKEYLARCEALLKHLETLG